MPAALDDHVFDVSRVPDGVRIADGPRRYALLRFRDEHLEVSSALTEPRPFPLTRDSFDAARSLTLKRLRRLARTSRRRPGTHQLALPGYDVVHRVYDVDGVGDQLIDLVIEAAKEENALVAEVDERLRAEHLRRTPLLASAPVRRHRWLLSDATRFRAARIAIARCEDLHVTWAALGVSMPPPDPRAWLPLLESWRGLYAPDLEPYRALNRTLDRFNDDLPEDWVVHFHRIRLTRPVQSILHGDVLAELARATQAWTHDIDGIQRALENAEHDDLAAAIDLATERLWHGNGDLVLWDAQLDSFIELVIRSQVGPGGSIVGWTRRCLDRVLAPRRGRRRRRLNATEPTARPPVPLPRQGGLRFLATVAEVRAEGRAMRHCIATYARSAVDGFCFLFHVQHAGEQASVEVSPDGHVVQANGPGNRSNRASRWGRRQLESWGQAFWLREVDPAAMLPAPPPDLLREDGEVVRTPAHAFELYCRMVDEGRDAEQLSRWFVDRIERAGREEVSLVAHESPDGLQVESRPWHPEEHAARELAGPMTPEEFFAFVRAEGRIPDGHGEVRR